MTLADILSLPQRQVHFLSLLPRCPLPLLLPIAASLGCHFLVLSLLQKEVLRLTARHRFQALDLLSQRCYSHRIRLRRAPGGPHQAHLSFLR